MYFFWKREGGVWQGLVWHAFFALPQSDPVHDVTTCSILLWRVLWLGGSSPGRDHAGGLRQKPELNPCSLPRIQLLAPSFGVQPRMLHISIFTCYHPEVAPSSSTEVAPYNLGFIRYQIFFQKLKTVVSLARRNAIHETRMMWYKEDPGTQH